jgi:predicted house-cleaning noncanonical NTP pyrophosphatase (MazG superfamily)
MSSKYGFFLQKKYNKKLAIIIFMLIFFLNFPKSKLGKHREQEIKICICTLGKNENRYIREFAQYYKNYNVDKILLYDNNDINGETFDIIIKDFIQDKFIKIINWRGKIREQIKIMNHCYNKNFDKYDWLIFYDIDEFIHLENYTDIKQFLKQEKFMNCQKIYLNWLFHTDNDLIKYDNRSLFKRFPIKDPNINKKKYYIPGKSILKGHIKNITINDMHALNQRIKGCNGFGKSISYHYPDFRYYYIDHFYCKSLEEFTEKLNNGCPNNYHDIKFILFRIKRYFSFNKKNIYKIKYIENKTRINLSKFYI